MRFPCLLLLCLPGLLCAAAFGQSGPSGTPRSFPGSDSASPFEPQFNFDVSALPNRAATNPTLSPCPDASSARPKRFWFDRKALGKLPLPSGIDAQTEMTARIDPHMVFQPPQSSIGNLPSKPVLPNIYPHLRMLFIHGQASTKPTGE